MSRGDALLPFERECPFRHQERGFVPRGALALQGRRGVPHACPARCLQLRPPGHGDIHQGLVPRLEYQELRRVLRGYPGHRACRLLFRRLQAVGDHLAAHKPCLSRQYGIQGLYVIEGDKRLWRGASPTGERERIRRPAFRLPHPCAQREGGRLCEGMAREGGTPYHLLCQRRKHDRDCDE